MKDSIEIGWLYTLVPSCCSVRMRNYSYGHSCLSFGNNLVSETRLLPEKSWWVWYPVNSSRFQVLLNCLLSLFVLQMPSPLGLKRLFNWLLRTKYTGLNFQYNWKLIPPFLLLPNSPVALVLIMPPFSVGLFQWSTFPFYESCTA